MATDSRLDPDGGAPKEETHNKKTTSVEKAKAKKFGKLGIISLALNAGVGVSAFSSSQNEGDSVVTSATKAATETAVASVIGPGKFLAGVGLLKVPGFVGDQYESFNKRARELERAGSMAPFAGNTFVDNTQIFTMRQASMAMMQQSKYGLEHAMQGSEAGFLHR